MTISLSEQSLSVRRNNNDCDGNDPSAFKQSIFLCVFISDVTYVGFIFLYIDFDKIVQEY